MQTRVITRITINAPQARVFEYLADLKYHPLWNPQMRSIAPIRRLTLGSEYKTSSIVLGVRINAKNVVTKFRELEEIELQNNTGTVHYKAHFKLSGDKKCAKLVCVTTVSSDSEAFYFAKPVLKLLARRELQADMQALKIAAEHKLPPR